MNAKTELTPKAQIAELIRNSANILILSHLNPDGDSVGSALALKLVLTKLGKQADVAMFGPLPAQCSFLPGYDQIKNAVAASNDLVITIDTRATGEELKLGHKKLTDQHQVVIVISPPKGSLLPEDVTISRSRPKYDLVVALDCASSERLGPIFEELPDLFFEVPTASIDHHATNSYFAKANWVDMTATSTAEMLVSLIESLSRNESLLDPDIATCLLTGLTTDTGSFQNNTTTPKSLTVAAQLVAAGARQQEIVDQLYRTRPLSTLKLWGRILTKLQVNKDLHFAWAGITQEDLDLVGATVEQLSGAVDELLKTVAEVDFVLLLSDQPDHVRGSLRTVSRGFNVAEVAQQFGGGGHLAAAGFEVPGSLKEKEVEIITRLETFLKAGQAKTAAPA